MDNLIMKQQEHPIYYDINTRVIRIKLLQFYCFGFDFRTRLKV